MNKNYKFYVVCWAVLLALFNVIAFVVPSIPAGEKFTASFFIGYVFVTLAFIGNLVCSFFAFREDDKQKFFYSLPLVTLAYGGLIVSFIIGVICSIFSVIPGWIAAVVCCIILAVYVIAIMKTRAAGDIVAEIDEKVKVKTFFIKSLTVDADTLLAGAQTEEAKAACKKVFEAVRYSDPMSNDALAGVESQITLKFNEFSDAITGGAENISVLADELVILVGDRNKKCKLVK